MGFVRSFAAGHLVLARPTRRWEARAPLKSARASQRFHIGAPTVLARCAATELSNSLRNFSRAAQSCSRPAKSSGVSSRDRRSSSASRSSSCIRRSFHMLVVSARRFVSDTKSVQSGRCCSSRARVVASRCGFGRVAPVGHRSPRCPRRTLFQAERTSEGRDGSQSHPATGCGCQGQLSVTVFSPAVSGGSGRSWSGGGLTPRPVVVRRD